MDARFCFGEGDQVALGVVADQAPHVVGELGVCEKILMRDLLVGLSKDNVVHFTLLKS